jgi:WD repeat-containing protein 26
MRSDDAPSHPVSNGFANGSVPRKIAASGSINGHSPRTVNGSGSSHTNGSVKHSSPVQPPTYYGHNREEVTRILIQGLLDMGYNGAAASLSHESGFELESPSVAAFRISILEGQWTEAENILLGSRYSNSAGDGYGELPEQGIVLAEGADRGQMQFWIRQQKFLELLEQRELSLALMVLRQELTPLHHDMHQLHALSALLMCPAEDLRAQAHWEGTVDESRQRLLHELTQSISPSVMLRDHRLVELLDQVKRSQINDCLYHNTSVPPSLYSDHICDRDNFPLRTMLELDHHTQEVWYLQFSPDGRWLATASQDASVMIYDTSAFTVSHRLTGHDKEVTYLSWSPDSSKLISCSKDTKARVWDVVTGRCLMTVDHRSTHPISAAAWAPDSQSFVTSCLDKETQLCHWSLEASEAESPVHTWNGGFRAQDCAISPDGSKLVVIDSEKHLYIYNFHSYAREYQVTFPHKLTSITISQNSDLMLVSLTNGEIQLLDIKTADMIRKFEGHKQGEFIIRSSFGGAAENFVLSGSEGRWPTRDEWLT